MMSDALAYEFIEYQITLCYLVLFALGFNANL